MTKSPPFLHFDDWPQWSIDLGFWLDRRFSSNVLARLDERSTWVTWLDQEQAAVDGEHHDSNALFREFVLENFAGVRTYHATRLTRLTDLAKTGLRAWSGDELREQAWREFGGRANDAQLARTIEQCGPDHRGGHVYTFPALSVALCIEMDVPGKLSTFSEGGSEWLRAVGNNLNPPLAVTSLDAGRPYVIACDLPWNLMAPATATWVSEKLLGRILVRRFFDPKVYSLLGEWRCISVTSDIRPEHLVAVSDVERLVGQNIDSGVELEWVPFHEALTHLACKK